MDIETRLHLRTTIKSDVTPIINSIMAALLLHALLWFSWQEEKPTKAKIPEWINVKLIAGLEVEEKKAETKEIIKKIQTPIKKEVAFADKNKIVREVTETKKKSVSGTTFIAADSQPYHIQNPKPVYPSAARRRGMQGIVLLSVEISDAGYVENIRILQSTGFRVLDQSAVTSVHHWHFIPAKQGEKNISSKLEIPIRFILNEI